MKQITIDKSQKEYLRILGKGMVAIPKQWREELGLEEGGLVKAQKVGSKMIIEAQSKTVPYRIFSKEEIETWLEEDRFSASLAKKVEKKLKSQKSD